jgi:hypothetical protein
LVVALVALMVAGGVALAKTVDGDDGPNNLNGTAQADVIRGQEQPARLPRAAR